MRLLVFGALLMLTLVSAAFAADINGKWKATFQGGDMAIEQNFTFKVDVKKSLWGAASAGGLELAISLPISGHNAWLLAIFRVPDLRGRACARGPLAKSSRVVNEGEAAGLRDLAPVV